MALRKDSCILIHPARERHRHPRERRARGEPVGQGAACAVHYSAPTSMEEASAARSRRLRGAAGPSVTLRIASGRARRRPGRAGGAPGSALLRIASPRRSGCVKARSAVQTGQRQVARRRLGSRHRQVPIKAHPPTNPACGAPGMGCGQIPWLAPGPARLLRAARADGRLSG